MSILRFDRRSLALAAGVLALGAAGVVGWTVLHRSAPVDAGAVRALIRDGHYADADRLATGLVARSGGSAGEAEALDLLVEARWRGGRAGEAETLALAQRALDLAGRVFGTDDPRCAVGLQNLANVLRLAGDRAGARARFAEALALRERTLGPDHPDVAQSANGLAAALLDDGDVEGAERLFARALAIREKALGAESREVAQSLNNLASVRRLAGDLSGARTLYERALALAEKRLGPEHPDVAQALENLGLVRQLAGDLRGARPALERALAIKERALGPDHPAVGRSLDTLAQLVAQLGDPAAALPLAERSLAIAEAAHEGDHPDVAASLDTLAGLAAARGDLGRARAVYERALALRERLLGPGHRDVGDTLNNLAVVCADAGDLTRARALHERALAIRETELGPDHPGIADSLHNAANVLLAAGEPERARALLRRAVAIRERTLGGEHPDLAAALNNLAVVERVRGDFPAARALLERALAIREQALGPDHPAVAETLENLAELLGALGDDGAATRHLARALAIRERAHGSGHPLVARTVAALGRTSLAAGDVAGATASFERALSIRERAFGTAHPDVAESLEDLAAAGLARGDTAGAGRLYERSLEIRTRAPGTAPLRVAQVLDNLGAVRLRAGDARAALAFHERALPIWRAALGPDHPEIGWTLGAIAAARYAIGDMAGAVDAALTADEITRGHLRLTARGLPEREALRFASRRSPALGAALAAVAGGRVEERAADVFAAVIRSRAVVLDEMAARARDVAAARDPEMRGLARALAAARSSLARAMLQPAPDGSPEARVAAVDRARDVKERLERELTARGGSAADALAPDDASTEDLRRALPPGAALIAYARYGAPDGRDEYAAFVLTPGEDRPRVVALGPADEIDALVARWRAAVLGARGALPVAQGAAERLYLEAATELSRRVWGPVAGGLPSAATVFVVPDGALHLVSFGALPAGDGTFVVERGLRLRCLSAERDLLRPARERRPADRGLLIVADPEFGPAAATAAGGASAFTRLAGTRTEAEAVAAAWRARGGDDVDLLAAAAATEDAFVAEAPRHSALHLATHGFYLDRPDGLQSSPLALAGIALAGANRPRNATAQAAHDGLLTADEIASLDLRSVEWAVLSGCETGRGLVAAGEGVLGLRRAFQLAGVDTLVVSLWPVEDVHAQALMRELHAAHARGASMSDAVVEAQRTLLAAARAAGRTTHPFAWGAFVATGAGD